jgi:hypothetical protein
MGGQTGTNLTLNNVQPASAGEYRVQITNSFGSILSDAAMLTVLVAPTISVPPQSIAVNAGSNAVFTVTAAGTAPLRYQWQHNSANLAGKTNDVLTINSVSWSDAGNYRVIVTNAAGAITSSVAVLTVQTPPMITAHPLGGFVLPGSTMTMNVSATGDAPLAYQWRFNGTNINGATGFSLVLNNVQATNSGSYTVLVTNAAGWALGGPAVVTVVDAPSLNAPQITFEHEFACILTGPTNHTYAIEASTNLVDWFEVGTITHTNAQTFIVDPEAPDFAGRCYRARIVQ